MKLKSSITKLALFFTAVTMVHAATTLTLAPASGAISGGAGAMIGWGFTLSNPANFAVVSSSNFCLGTTGVNSLCVAPTIGTYSDDIATNFVIAGPSPESPVVTQAFSASAGTGIGSLTINGAAPIGATNVGQLVVTYDLYSVDPLASNFDPGTDLVSTGNFLTDPAAILVAAPEPSSRLPLLVVLGVLFVCSCRPHKLPLFPNLK